MLFIPVIIFVIAMSGGDTLRLPCATFTAIPKWPKGQVFNAERGARELNKAMSSANSDNIYYVYFKLPSVPEGAAAAALVDLPH